MWSGRVFFTFPLKPSFARPPLERTGSNPAFGAGRLRHLLRAAQALPDGEINPTKGKTGGSTYRPVGQLHALDLQDLQSPQQEGRWQALAACAAQPNPFYEHWFLLPSLRTLDPQGKVSMLCLEVDGQLAGLMPIVRQSSYYGYPLPHIANWLHTNAFCGQPLVAAGMEALFWRELLAWCDRNAGKSLFLHLAQMPGQGVIHEALKLVAASDNRPAATVLDEERALLATRLDADAYLTQSLAQKKRKELRRQHRRLAEEGRLEVLRTRDVAGLEQWCHEFLDLEARGWKGRAGSSLAADPGNAAMFRQVIAGAANAGKLERLTLVLDGKPIAMLATLLTPPGAYSFKTAFDEDYARFSPGVLLQIENLSLAEDPEIAWVDSCAAQDHKMIDHLWRERRRIACHSVGIGGSLRRKVFAKLSRRETGVVAGGIA